VPVGSAPDMLSRIIGAGFQAKWGQPAVVDPKPGASQNIAAEALFRADPDGYTLLTAPPPALAINEYLFPKLNFDPHALTPVTVLVEVPNVLVTRAGLEVKNVAELVALAKSKPGGLNYGSTGVGGTPHLTAEAFNFRAGVKIVHVPYKGTVEILNDLFGERIDIGFLNLLDVVAHVEAGKLKALAVTSAERSAAFPDVPTMKDTIPDFIATTWFANIAPPKTPEPIAKAISDTIREAFETPEAKRIIGGLKGARTVLNTPAEAAAYIRADSLRWKDVIEKNGIKAE
jgi:tripartite-type tricarboxylate transporter receptor subunit TctC